MAKTKKEDAVVHTDDVPLKVVKVDKNDLYTTVIIQGLTPTQVTDTGARQLAYEQRTALNMDLNRTALEPQGSYYPVDKNGKEIPFNSDKPVIGYQQIYRLRPIF